MSNNLIFHLLDLYARDQVIENETDEMKEVIYESGDEESDGEFHSLRKSRKKNYNSKKREFIIHLFGETAEGKSVRADIVGFRPSFYLKLPIDKSSEAIDSIKRYMAANKVVLGNINFKKVYHESFMGFTAKTKYPFLCMDFPSLGMWRDARNLFLNDKSMPATKSQLDSPYKKGESPEVFEANIDPMLRFVHVQNIQPSGWVTIEDGLDVCDDENGVLVLTCEYDCVEPCKAPPRATAPFLLASWDIECYSLTGDFPVAKSGNWKKLVKGLKGTKVADFGQKCKELFKDDHIHYSSKAPKVESRFIAHISTDEFAAGYTLAVNSANDDTIAEYLKTNLGKFIEPSGDPAIQIGVSLTRDCKSIERHLFVWPSCSPCEGIVVHNSADEKSMINDFFKWFVEINPDILIGYNVFGFDEKYLWERAVEKGCIYDGAPVHGLNRLCELGSEVKLEEKFLSSSALGDNYLYTWTTQGRLQIDLYHYIRRSANLPSYKLDEVTKNYMSGKLKNHSIEDGNLILEASGAVKDIRTGRAICLLDATGESITDKMVVTSVSGSTIVVKAPTDPDIIAELDDAQKWVVVKDDVSPQDIFRLHRGSADDRAEVGRYCIQDCDLVIELYKKLEVFNNAMSMANVCSVPISYIFMRGQGIKAESLIFKACRERGIVIPVLPAPKQPGQGGAEDSYEGAIVLDPEPGFYSESPIGVADFASLYPSTIESENISHDSLVWVKDFTYDGKLIAVQFGNDEFDEYEGYGYTDIEFDIWRPDPEDKRKHPVKIKSGRRICRYAQPLNGSKSTLPEIIRSLLAARKAKRKEAEKETDPERAALLDAEQLAYKLTGNSLYGQLGSGTFKVRLQHLAASVTAYGRKQILFAKAVIEKFYSAPTDEDKKFRKCDAKIMYGDTDSLFVEFNPRDPKTGERLKGREARQAVIDLTAEAGHFVTKALKPPHDFEFDKVFDPMLMFSKKRYAGLMFENNADEFVHKYMGIALKRRDNAPFVKTIFGGAMKKLLLERDVPGATILVKELCNDLVHDKVSLNQLTITKSLRADYANPLSIAHKVLADRITERDPGNAPASGDRIGFIYIRPKPGQVEAKLQGDRIETPSYVRENKLLPDYRFYIEHQIQNPVSQMFGILLESMPGFDCRLLAECPEDSDKRIVWREGMAAKLLFDDSLRLCNQSDKKNFMKTFFGTSVTPIKKVISTGSIASAASAQSTTSKSSTTPPKKAVQSSISSFILDSYLASKIIEKDKKTKEAKEAKDKVKEKAKK